MIQSNRAPIRKQPVHRRLDNIWRYIGKWHHNFQWIGMLHKRTAMNLLRQWSQGKWLDRLGNLRHRWFGMCSLSPWPWQHMIERRCHMVLLKQMKIVSHRRNHIFFKQKLAYFSVYPMKNVLNGYVLSSGISIRNVRRSPIRTVSTSWLRVSKMRIRGGGASGDELIWIISGSLLIRRKEGIQ